MGQARCSLVEGGGPLYVEAHVTMASMPERLHKRLYITLPVCPEPSCKQVGKVPLAGRVKMRGYCTGEITNPHKKQRMIETLFVESRAKVKEPDER